MGGGRGKGKFPVAFLSGAVIIYTDVLYPLKTKLVTFFFFFCFRLTFPEKSPKRVLDTGFPSFPFPHLSLVPSPLLPSTDIFGGWQISPIRQLQRSDMEVKMVGHTNIATASNFAQYFLTANASLWEQQEKSEPLAYDSFHVFNPQAHQLSAGLLGQSQKQPI